jgi:hypothetical protein
VPPNWFCHFMLAVKWKLITRLSISLLVPHCKTRKWLYDLQSVGGQPCKVRFWAKCLCAAIMWSFLLCTVFWFRIVGIRNQGGWARQQNKKLVIILQISGGDFLLFISENNP